MHIRRELKELTSREKKATMKNGKVLSARKVSIHLTPSVQSSLSVAVRPENETLGFRK